MKQSVFVVRRFKNRNGVFSWRVQGTLNGVRIRRNFKTQEDAAAEKASLEVSAVQLNSNLRSVPTWLTEPQVREAESVFARLPGGGRSVAFFFDLGVASHREPLRQRVLAEAVDDYVATKAQEHGYGLISPSQLTTIRRHMNALKRRFSGFTVAEHVQTISQRNPFSDVRIDVPRLIQEQGEREQSLAAAQSTPPTPVDWTAVITSTQALQKA